MFPTQVKMMINNEFMLKRLVIFARVSKINHIIEANANVVRATVKTSHP